MIDHANKTSQGKNQDISSENTESQLQNNTETTHGLFEAGADVHGQGYLKSMADKNPRLNQLKSIQEMASNGHQGKASTQLQAKANDFSYKKHHLIQLQEKMNNHEDFRSKKEADLMKSKASTLEDQNLSLPDVQSVGWHMTSQLAKIQPSDPVGVDPNNLKTSPASKSNPVLDAQELQTSPAGKLSDGLKTSTEQKVQEILAEEFEPMGYTYGRILFKLGIGKALNIMGLTESQFEEDKKLRIDGARAGATDDNLRDRNFDKEAEEARLEWERNGRKGSPPYTAEQLKNIAIASKFESKETPSGDPIEAKGTEPDKLARLIRVGEQLGDKAYSSVEGIDEFGAPLDDTKGMLEELLPKDSESLETREEDLNTVSSGLLDAGSSPEEVKGVMQGDEIGQKVLDRLDWISPVVNNAKGLLGFWDVLKAIRTKGKDNKLKKRDKASQGFERMAESGAANAEYFVDNKTSTLGDLSDADVTGGAFPTITKSIQLAIAAIHAGFDFHDQLSIANVSTRSDKAKTWVDHIKHRLMLRQGANLFKATIAGLSLTSAILTFMIESIVTGSPGLATAATAFMVAGTIGSISALIAKYYSKKKVKEKIQIVQAQQIDEPNYVKGEKSWIKIDGKMVELTKAEVIVDSEMDQMLETIKKEVDKNKNEAFVEIERQSKSDKTVQEIETTFTKGERERIILNEEYERNRKEMNLIELTEDEGPADRFLKNSLSIKQVFKTNDKIIIYYQVSDAKNILNALRIPINESGKFDILRRKLSVAERL